MKLLHKILKLNQVQLYKYLKQYLKNNNYKVYDGTNNFIYAEGNIPVMLVAHLDTVHKKSPDEIYYDKKNNILWSPQGIGGDDRAGVYAITQIIKDFKPHILFCCDEEIGCVGANIAKKRINPNINFIIELDRQGKNDAVFYDCGNEEFKEYICSFGFQEDYGTYSDISSLSPEWDIASVNLSIGYYNQHTTSEYIKLNETMETINKVKEILSKSNDIYYDFQETQYGYYNEQYNYENIDIYGEFCECCGTYMYSYEINQCTFCGYKHHSIF